MSTQTKPTPTPAQTAAPVLNAQTPGPLEWQTEEGGELCTNRGFALWAGDSLVAERRPESPDIPREPMGANARLLAASFNAFDRAGRALGVDAAELAEGLDLVALIHAARECVVSASIRDGYEVNALARALAPLSTLTTATEPTAGAGAGAKGGKGRTP